MELDSIIREVDSKLVEVDSKYEVLLKVWYLERVMREIYFYNCGKLVRCVSLAIGFLTGAKT
ncbi:hypothetical protein QF028_005781 [Neobacillus sp. B4I6]